MSSLANIFDSSESEGEKELKAQTSQREDREVKKEKDTEAESPAEEQNRKSEEYEEYKSSSASELENISPEDMSEEEPKSEDVDEEEIVDTLSRGRRGKKKGKKPKGSDEEEEQTQTISEKALEARKDFAEAMARVTPSGGRRKRQDGVAFSDSVEFDDFAISLRNKMESALKRDIQSMNNGKAALERLKLLPQVIAALNRRGLQDILLENGILSSIRLWLEPLMTDTSCSLPGINLRKPLLEILRSLPIDTANLRESGIGRIVYFFSKKEDEASEVKRLSSELVIKWSQPIIASFEADFSTDNSYTQTTTDYDTGVGEKHLESEKFRKLKQSGDTQSLSSSQYYSQSVYQKLASKGKRR